jgi:succinate dehydrogenase hydrophobic anchor subunit
MATVSIVLLVLLAIGMLFLLSALLQWLWNMTMPQVFNLKNIEYWQAFRLLLIAAILFGGPNINLGN